MIRQDKLGIWKYKKLIPETSPSYMRTLGEGNTSYKVKGGIGFKCEYENPTGSVKDRGISFQLAKAAELRFTKAVISSSGNAAISAAGYSKLFGINLQIFVSPRINKGKLNTLRGLGCQIIINSKPVSSAYKYAIEFNAYNLRQSTDVNATYGYQTIAYELIEDNPDIDAIFLPVSSGTTMVGIFDGYKNHNKIPAFHLIQTEAVHPIASLFDKDFNDKKESLGDAIVAKFTAREKHIQEIVEKSRGYGWVISDKEMEENHKWLRNNGFMCSFEGSAVLSALYKSQKKGYKYKNPVCILTGKYYTL